MQITAFCSTWLLLSISRIDAFIPSTKTSSLSSTTLPFSKPTFGKRRNDIRNTLAFSADDLTPLCKGSYVALVTPMTDSGEIDSSNLRTLLQFHVSSGTNGICLLGTTAEASLMSSQERETVLKIAVEECKGRIPILVGCGGINPTQIKSDTIQARDLGADGALIVTPPYVKPPQRGLVNLFTSIAEVGLPLILYNVPGRTGVDLLPETIKLCKDSHPNIVGVKEATGIVERANQIRELCGDDFLLLSGDDGSTLDFIIKGTGDGCISVTANVAPSEVATMVRYGLDGDSAKGNVIKEKLETLNSKLFIEANPIAVKWALKRMNKMDTAYCRMPLDELDSIYHGEVEDAMKIAGLITSS